MVIIPNSEFLPIHVSFPEVKIDFREQDLKLIPARPEVLTTLTFNPKRASLTRGFSFLISISPRAQWEHLSQIVSKPFGKASLGFTNYHPLFLYVLPTIIPLCSIEPFLLLDSALKHLLPLYNLSLVQKLMVIMGVKNQMKCSHLP